MPPRPHEGERIASAAAAIAGGRGGIGGSLFASSSSFFFSFVRLPACFRWVFAIFFPASGCVVGLSRWLPRLGYGPGVVADEEGKQKQVGPGVTAVEQPVFASGGYVFRFGFRYRLVRVVLSVRERNPLLY